MHIVLTTIIILVASLTLAVGVIQYGTSLFQGAAQQESFTVFGTKLWVHGSDDNGLAWGAFSARNGGDKILSINRISIRGQDVPFSQWFPDTNATGTKLQQSMNFSGWSGTDGLLYKTSADTNCSGTNTIEINIAAGEYVCADASSGPVSLEPGAGVIIYYKLTNGTLRSIDSGGTTNIGIYSELAVTAIRVTINGKL